MSSSARRALNRAKRDRGEKKKENEEERRGRRRRRKGRRKGRKLKVDDDDSSVKGRRWRFRGRKIAQMGKEKLFT